MNPIATRQKGANGNGRGRGPISGAEAILAIMHEVNLAQEPKKVEAAIISIANFSAERDELQRARVSRLGIFQGAHHPKALGAAG